MSQVVETKRLNGMKQINTSRRKSARNLRNSERRYVSLSFRSSRFGTAEFIFMHRWKKRRLSSCVSPHPPFLLVARCVTHDTYDVGGAAKGARRNHVFLNRKYTLPEVSVCVLRYSLYTLDDETNLLILRRTSRWYIFRRDLPAICI